MISINQAISPQVLNNHISAQVAASYSGYSLQYLRRLLRNGKLEGIKIGQLWLVEKRALDFYIEQAQHSTNHRFGPK
jgi:excisionase family DNA binding protein